ncbi:unnamed protein product, partial [Allacma fusca]
TDIPQACSISTQLYFYYIWRDKGRAWNTTSIYIATFSNPMSDTSTKTDEGDPKLKRNKKRMESSMVTVATQGVTSTTATSKPKNLTGFARGLEAQAIVGATDASGELCYLIQWNGTKELDLVPAREANKKCPQVVISFYESKIFCQPREQ